MFLQCHYDKHFCCNCQSSYCCLSTPFCLSQLVLLEMSNFSIERTYNDSELMSELDSQMNDLYVLEVKPTDGEADVTLIAVNVAFNDVRIKR